MKAGEELVKNSSTRTSIYAARKKVVPFERDATFYLRRGLLYYQKNKQEKALRYFKKAVSVEPQNPFNHYNLACMLSKQGQLKEANRIFLHIINRLDETMTDCYFLLAVNYGLLDEMEKSREYLLRYLQTDPDGDLSLEAAELLAAFDEDAALYALPAYAQTNFALEEIITGAQTEEAAALYHNNYRFRRALDNMLYARTDLYKEEILFFYGRLGGREACRALRRFVRNPWIKERFRQLALLELKNLGESKVRIYAAGQFREVDLTQYPLRTPTWRPEWQQVIDCTIRTMRASNCYDESFYADVQAIWLDYINTVYPRTPRINKIQTWAAALEYSLARYHFLTLTQKELAAEYGVSCASISNKFRKINQALQLEERAYQNMLSYLQEEPEY
ncbi:MAG TPA: hypothetical protein DCE00_05950 [Firmicutes bacterium]|jgi:Tfp pilus assembly protein PilF|nr:hypothetical protein [Bacillota bacterium]